MPQQTEEKLNRLAAMRNQIQNINMHFDKLKESLIPDEIRQQLEAIEAERQSAMDAAEVGVRALEDSIRKEILRDGETVQGNLLMAVHNTRTNWDTKALDTYAEDHPEILAFRSQTEYVSIREKSPAQDI